MRVSVKVERDRSRQDGADLTPFTNLIRTLAQAKVQAGRISRFNADIFVDLVDRAIVEVGRQIRVDQRTRKRHRDDHE